MDLYGTLVEYGNKLFISDSMKEEFWCFRYFRENIVLFKWFDVMLRIERALQVRKNASVASDFEDSRLCP